MYAKELKAQVRGDAYVVDTHLVAEALLRAAIAERASAPAITITRRGVRDRVAGGLRFRPTA
jgi:hypothetical protein